MRRDKKNSQGELRKALKYSNIDSNYDGQQNLLGQIVSNPDQISFSPAIKQPAFSSGNFGLGDKKPPRSS